MPVSCLPRLRQRRKGSRSGSRCSSPERLGVATGSTASPAMPTATHKVGQTPMAVPRMPPSRPPIGHRPPDQEPGAGVHPAQQLGWAQPLPEADGRDVVAPRWPPSALHRRRSGSPPPAARRPAGGEVMNTDMPLRCSDDRRPLADRPAERRGGDGAEQAARGDGRLHDPDGAAPRSAESSTMYRTDSAASMLPARFPIPVQAISRRSSGCPSDERPVPRRSR